MFAWLPKTISGVVYPAVWSDQWISMEDPAPPVIVLTLMGTVRSMGFDSPLSVEYNEEEDVYDDRWGHYEKATLSVDFQTLDPDERDIFGYEFGLELLKKRLNLIWDDDKLKLTDILLDGAKLDYVDEQGRIIYRSVTDIEFEAEVSYVDQVPAIRSFGVMFTDSTGVEKLRYVLFAPGCMGVSTRLV